MIQRQAPQEAAMPNDDDLLLSFEIIEAMCSLKDLVSRLSTRNKMLSPRDIEDATGIIQRGLGAWTALVRAIASGNFVIAMDLSGSLTTVQELARHLASPHTSPGWMSSTRRLAMASMQELDARGWRDEAADF